MRLGNSLFRASDPSNLFSLGESVYRSDGLVTAVVKSKAPIDREEIGSNYEITVQVNHSMFLLFYSYSFICFGTFV